MTGLVYLLRGSPPGPGRRRARQRSHPYPPLRAMLPHAVCPYRPDERAPTTLVARRAEPHWPVTQATAQRPHGLRPGV